MRIPLGIAPIVVALVVLTWNITLAGWIAARREGPQWFARLTGLAGLLVAPAAVIAVAISSDAGARTVTGVAWLWPLTCLLLALQAMAATALRDVSSSVGVPIIAYNLVLCALALGDDLVARTGSAPLLLQGAIAARGAVLGLVMGPAALASPVALLVPLLAPAYPARWRASATFRALLVLYATVMTTLLALEWPRGLAAVESYAQADTPSASAGDARLVQGVRVLPVLSGAPRARAVRAAATIYERVAPAAVLVLLRLEEGQVAGLDSVARTLATVRSDGARVLVALTFERADAYAVQRSPEMTHRRRLTAVEQIVAQLRPDVFIPLWRPAVPSLLGEPDVAPRWITRQLTAAAATVQRVRPATDIAWIATRFDRADSTLYHWAAAESSPVEVLGFAPTPTFSGLPSLDARLRAADRWFRATATHERPHWLFTSGLPRAHGDIAQRDGVQHVLAWSQQRAWVRGVIVGEPSDDANTTGLVAANGRSRAVLDVLVRSR
jgi:hypothetical protein